MKIAELDRNVDEVIGRMGERGLKKEVRRLVDNLNSIQEIAQDPQLTDAARRSYIRDICSGAMHRYTVGKLP